MKKSILFMLVALCGGFGLHADTVANSVGAGPSPAATPTSKEDFFTTRKIERRWDFNKEPATKLFDESCYNYYSSMKIPPVNAKADQPAGQGARNAQYIAAMRKIYAGGRIIIHDTETPDANFLKAHKARGYGDYAYHFIMTPDCKVHEGRPLNMMGTHAGRYFGKDSECSAKHSYNLANDFDFKAIGIAMVGSNPIGCQSELKSLVSSLSRTLGIAGIGGHGHYELPSTDCPAGNLAGFLGANFNRNSSPKLEGVSGKSMSMQGLVSKANGSSTECTNYFGGTIPYTRALLAGKIAKGKLPVNDNSPPVTCHQCYAPGKSAPTLCKKKA